MSYLQPKKQTQLQKGFVIWNKVETAVGGFALKKNTDFNEFVKDGILLAGTPLLIDTTKKEVKGLAKQAPADNERMGFLYENTSYEDGQPLSIVIIGQGQFTELAETSQKGKIKTANKLMSTIFVN